MSQSILERRRIEAEIVKPIYDELVLQYGREAADAVVGRAVRKHAIAQASGFRAELGENSGIEGFYSTLHLWTMNGALEIEVLEQTPETLAFNVHRCRYSEMYREMGLGEIGHLLSCQRDGVFCQGIDPRIRFERTQTIMGGASHCDFRYTLADTAEPDAPESA